MLRKKKEQKYELEGNNRAENAGGNITSLALSACLAKSQFEGCATQQMLRFRATVLLSSHLNKIHWICCRCGGDCSSGLWGWAGQKIGNEIFQTW
jgi:hypothetical protein